MIGKSTQDYQKSGTVSSMKEVGPMRDDAGEVSSHVSLKHEF